LTVTTSTSTPAEGKIPYTPQLDGIRAVAIASVVLYHGGIAGAGGGFLGVDAFFVLSGFLITTLLVREYRSRGSISLSHFWLRRARRLLPALILMLLVVSVYAVVLASPDQLASIRGDALSTLFYVANWHQIIANQGYFAQADATSPLLHTWSLGIEEQFYLLWPLIIFGVLLWRRSLRLCLVVALAGCMASAVEMALLFHPGFDPSRIYYGTDTRAQALLVGASLGLLLAVVPSLTSRNVSRWLQPLGLAAAAAFAFMVVVVNSNTSAMYRGGFLLAALLVALLIWAVVAVPRSPLAAGLSLGLVVYIGRISYGLYLWHWPADRILDGSRTGLSGWPLFFLRTGVAVALAVASYHLLERPIRERGLAGVLPLRGNRRRKAPSIAIAAMGITVLAILGATVVPAASPPTSALTTPVSDLRTHAPVRMLLVGDSMATYLGGDWRTVAPRYGVQLTNEGIIGCGLTSTGRVIVQGEAISDESAPYFSGVKCRRWPQYWTNQIDLTHPQVAAMLFGPFELRDHLLNGQWVHMGMPAWDNMEISNLQRAVSVLSAQGEKVVFFTSPYYKQGEQLDGAPWPEDDPARVNRWNALLREVAAGHKGTVSVIDLGRFLSPGGHYASVVHGVAVRWATNIHITPAGGALLAPFVFPQIVSLASP
jgi:peptidoglycan/LPS O-acetylase OafA/YrhL